MKRCVFLLFLLLLLLPYGYVYSHSGDTDANGGHYDRSTGTYHYHHGYPAHQHVNGKCPYNYDDKTGQNSGTTGGKGYYTFVTGTPKPTNAPANQEAKENADITPYVLAAIGVTTFVSRKVKKRREAERIRLAKEAAEKAKRIAFYRSNDLRTLSGMPDIYYVNDMNVPFEKDKPPGFMYGASLDVYLSHSSASNVYHRKECKYSRVLVNSISASRYYCLSTRRPCSLCNPPPLPDTKWYSTYLGHVSECKTLGIEPLREPVTSRAAISRTYIS